MSSTVKPSVGMDGPNNPRWKGGHKHWSKGRFGRDKDGLSWKVQRKLAWERDQYTCQHCGVKGRRNPDVHHIQPWLNSHSHALDNLICLCQKCHLTEEAKIHDVWVGQLVEDRPKYNVCEVCGKNARGPKCGSCKRLKGGRKRSGPPKKDLASSKHKAQIALKESLFPKVIELREAGMSLAQIAELLPIKIHRQTIFNWCKWGSVHKPKN